MRERTVNIGQRFRRSADREEMSAPSIGTVLRRLFSRIDDLSDSLQNYREAIGTKASPARTCQDVYAVRGPKAVSGEYWIDPNESSKKDAFPVNCTFETVQGKLQTKTCIKPLRSTVRTRAQKPPLHTWTRTPSLPLTGRSAELPQTARIQLVQHASRHRGPGIQGEKKVL